MNIENTRDLVKELTRIYNRFNKHFWNNELPEVMITFAPKKGSYGHITSIPVWISDSTSNKYELNISAYAINRPPQEIGETILHEQCHLYCIIHQIKDYSNERRYHNKKFKRIAEDHGLLCFHTKNYGWSKTTLSEDGLKYFNKLNVKQFAYNYQKQKAKETLYRYHCSVCDKTTAWLSSHQSIFCGTCNNLLIYDPIDEPHTYKS